MTPSHIHFFFNNTRISLTHRNLLKGFIEKMLSKHGKKIQSLNYIFCSDKTIRSINKEYLNHDYFTDIITFDLSETPGQLQAEIYISTDRVRQNAKTYNSTIREELHRVIFHGALHLCGFKDKTTSDKEQMRDMENKWLKMYGL